MMNMITIKKLLKAEIFYFGFFILLSFFGCSKTSNLSAREIVEKSIETHGGIVNWKNVKTLSFNKTTILFKEDGAIETKIEQKQSFQLQPEFKGEISWIENNAKHYISFDGKEAKKTINDSLVFSKIELQNVKNSIIAAHYVVSQPFKLLEENTILKYNGEERLDKKRVHAIAVGYSNDTETSDEWTYYFDVETYKLLANKVIHKPTASLIKNLDFNSETGLTFNAHRKSFTLDSLQQIKYLRAEYFYENFKVTY